MDAWNTLLLRSTAPGGSDAWEHLNAQEGGGGAAQLFVIEALLDANPLDVDVVLDDVTIDAAVKSLDVVVDSETFEIDADIEIEEAIQ